MKKLLLILLALGTGSLFAQVAYNDYYGGNVYASNYDTYTTGSNCGTSYSGGTSHYAPACAPNRVRWVASSCGTFRWRVFEDSYWIPGGYVYVNGCRRWNDGHYGWRQTRRVRVNNSHTCYRGCGHGFVPRAPRGGNGYGYAPRGPRGGHGHYNTPRGPRGGHGHGHVNTPRGPRGQTYNNSPRPRGGQGNGYGSNGPRGPRGGNNGYGNNNPRGPRGGGR